MADHDTPVALLLSELDRIDELLDMLEQMVQQDCQVVVNGIGTDEYFSNFITIYADAMRLLAKYGRMTIQDAGFRVVSGKFREDQ